MNKKRKHSRGQAITELIIILPVLFFLIIFGVQIFAAIYEAQGRQEEVRLAAMQKINYVANGGLGMSPSVTATQQSGVVQTWGIPIFGISETPAEATPDIQIRVGICRTESCR